MNPLSELSPVSTLQVNAKLSGGWVGPASRRLGDITAAIAAASVDLPGSTEVAEPRKEATHAPRYLWLP